MSDDLEVQQRKLRMRKILEEVRNMRGMGTELVTVIIPPERMIHDVRQQLSQEAGQAANIKSKSTKKHVTDAIESAISTLNRYKTPGDRGIALFVGHVIVGNNKSSRKKGVTHAIYGGHNCNWIRSSSENNC